MKQNATRALAFGLLSIGAASIGVSQKAATHFTLQCDGKMTNESVLQGMLQSRNDYVISYKLSFVITRDSGRVYNFEDSHWHPVMVTANSYTFMAHDTDGAWSAIDRNTGAFHYYYRNGDGAFFSTSVTDANCTKVQWSPPPEAKF